MNNLIVCACMCVITRIMFLHNYGMSPQPKILLRTRGSELRKRMQSCMLVCCNHACWFVHIIIYSILYVSTFPLIARVGTFLCAQSCMCVCHACVCVHAYVSVLTCVLCGWGGRGGGGLCVKYLPVVTLHGNTFCG